MLHIICFGNLWRGDDGFGIHVFRELNKGCVLPKHVKVFEGGVAGLQALPYFEDCRKLSSWMVSDRPGLSEVFIVSSRTTSAIPKRHGAFTISG